MVSPSVGTVVLVSFPFSDLSASKLRPAFILSGGERDDWLLCQITSNPYADSNAIEITDADFDCGSLQRISYARPGKLFTANASLIEPDAANRASPQPRTGATCPLAAEVAKATASTPSLNACAATQPSTGSPRRSAKIVPAPIAIDLVDSGCARINRFAPKYWRRRYGRMCARFFRILIESSRSGSDGWPGSQPTSGIRASRCA